MVEVIRDLQHNRARKAECASFPNCLLQAIIPLLYEKAKISRIDGRQIPQIPLVLNLASKWFFNPQLR